MADEIDRKYIPEFMQTTFSVSLGACYRSWEMMMSPRDSFSRMVSTMDELFAMPPATAVGLIEKFDAVAGVWLDKGIDIVEDCKSAGEKFTDPK
jgi:hypothetical protein